MPSRKSPVNPDPDAMQKRPVRETRARLEAALGGPRAGWALLLLLATAYASAYLLHPLFPGTGPAAMGRGWWTWNDQSRYLEEAAALARFELSPQTYHYPVGYPLLGALFSRAFPANPFFFPDLFLVLVAAAYWWRLARRSLSAVEALATGFAFVVFHRWLVAQTMIVPWNTLATQAALFAGIWIVISDSGPWVVGKLAALAAACYLARPVDAVAFAPLLVWAVLRLRTWREKFIFGSIGLAVLVCSFAGITRLNLAIFGRWQTPYDAVSLHSIGFFSYPVGYKFFWLFVDGHPFFHEAEPALLFRYPWLFLVVPAAAFWVRREGVSGLAALAAVALNLGLYVNYNDFLPSDVYRFTLIHYLAWVFPFLFLLLSIACLRGRGDPMVRASLGLAVAAFIVCAGLRLDEHPLPAEQRAEGDWALPTSRPLLVRFSGVKIERAADVRLDQRTLVEYSDYLVPYLPSDLQMIVGVRTKGRALSFPSGPEFSHLPEFASYVWRWRFSPARLRRMSQ